MIGGDAIALTKLMDRYDRLVRYTVVKLSGSRCVQDPDWLDTIAADTWTGFVRSVRRQPDKPPKSVRAYLVRIARNKCAGALRNAPRTLESLSKGEGDVGLDIPATTEEPSELFSRIELLEALRGCLGELGSADRELAGELALITERRWREAARKLGMSESTLRSRWSRTLERLRGCVTQKTGKTLAPEALESDF